MKRPLAFITLVAAIVLFTMFVVLAIAGASHARNPGTNSPNPFASVSTDAYGNPCGASGYVQPGC